MSLGIYPVLERKLMGTKFDALGEVLAANFDILDEIARAANLIPFTSFADNRPIPEAFEGDPDELAEIMGDWTEWFDPADGRATIHALVTHIKASPMSTIRLNEADRVVDELEEMARVLAVAESEGVRFRLEMS